jgi:hypothetical protein
VPGDCRAQPLEGFDYVACRIDLLTAAVSQQDPEVFGNPRKARTNLFHLDKASTLLDEARTAGPKQRTKLRLTMRQLRTFNRAVEKTTRNGKTPPDLAAYLSVLVQEALAELEVLFEAAPQ